MPEWWKLCTLHRLASNCIALRRLASPCIPLAYFAVASYPITPIQKERPSRGTAKLLGRHETCRTVNTCATCLTSLLNICTVLNMLCSNQGKILEEVLNISQWFTGAWAAQYHRHLTSPAGRWPRPRYKFWQISTPRSMSLEPRTSTKRTLWQNPFDVQRDRDRQIHLSPFTAGAKQSFSPSLPYKNCLVHLPSEPPNRPQRVRNNRFHVLIVVSMSSLSWCCTRLQAARSTLQ